MTEHALQDTYAAKGTCFGCGPRNEKGLRVKSYAKGDEVVATWHAEKHHEAFEGALSGGIAGTLLDCHSNWTAAYHLMRRASAATPPCTVTAEYAVKLLRPTPTAGAIELAHVPSRSPTTARSSSRSSARAARSARRLAGRSWR